MNNKTSVNIFISHYHLDAEFLPRLRNLLIKGGYDVRDSSIDERNPNNAKNPDYIKSLIRPKIEWAGKVLVLIGPQTHKREWVDWEIQYAGSFGNKRIIGIYLRGATDKLEAAIEGENIWLDTENKPRKGVYPLDRMNC